ncbi:MAG: ATP-binding protein [Acidobacteriota bacterium]
MPDKQIQTDDTRRTGALHPARPRALGWVAALASVVVLLVLGVANVAVRATWSEVEDGVLWVSRTQGVTAAEIARGSAAARADVRVGDVLLAIDGVPIERPADVVAVAHESSGTIPLTYTLLRLGSREMVQVRLAPIPQGNSVLYFILASVGIFTLLVAAMVRLRRPGDQASLHAFWLAVSFFGTFTFSFNGRFDLLDWVFYWADAVSILVLPPLLLHFTFKFPERSNAWVRTAIGARAIPLLYLPALLMGAARILAVGRLDANSDLIRVVAALDRVEPAYLALYLAGGFAVLVHALARVRSVTARRQLRWIVWGTVLGGTPFAFGYAVPFAFGVQPSVRMELLAIPLGLVPLAFASAIVRYRLMDVEVIVKRGLVYVAAVAAIVAVYAVLLRFAGWVFLAGSSQHNTVIAVLATLVIVLLARPLKELIQDALDRAFYRDRYDYRRALVGFARDLSTDLDLERLSQRLVMRVTETLVVDRMSLLLLDEAAGQFRPIRSQGFIGEPPRLDRESAIGRRLASGHAVTLDDAVSHRRFPPEAVEFWRDHGIHYFIPCVSKQTTIAVLALGEKERHEPLSSEDMALLVAVAAQVATAIENGRLYQALRAQASEVERMRQFNENILESLDDGLAVVDGRDRVIRWNRALEGLAGVCREEAVGRRFDEFLPASVVETLHAARARHPEGAALYRVPLATPRRPDGEALVVNITAVPLQGRQPGEFAEGTIIVFEDVTARARLEEQLQISDKMASIGLLAAGVAHEVNTPLTGISSYTQMLLERADPESPATQLLEKIERQTFRAAKIVNGLLALARGGQASNERSLVDLNVVVNDVLSLLEHQFKTVKVQVRRELWPEPVMVEGMEHKLQQVLLNLFINARDAMPKGGWLSISTRSDGDSAVVEIADTGVGIPADQLARIYDPFFTTKSIGQGTGLGLSITYGIVREHEGTISCHSRPGEGARFTLTFPLATAAQRVHAVGQ